MLSSQDKVIGAYQIDLQGMEEVSRRLLEQMNKGLESHDSDSTVKMLITYVHSLPDGSESGDFLALDLGEASSCLQPHAWVVTAHVLF